ncbi:type II toxin-antitoxin system HicB family antitoxin [Halalkalibacter oceani]|uniref:Type II toxin-antitoxin system HicB family antitoxin n=1 Tax=Halalkalibacter oceani TaxID=1653776 RepID=A0A9X2DTF0_9BACI|nr:type II toxin-antitoxin system HicB family antitoxin [Halalkalibacter oceani]MCM3714973.1 type II toxin-antitoxin system HicB family antitoxin [Halalkalibacter oceani]
MTRESRLLRDGFHPEDFQWRVRKVFDWCGKVEIMIELEELDGCLSFGDTVREAKDGLKEALYLWIRRHGEQQLPEVQQSAHLIILEPPMTTKEFHHVNDEVKKMN